MSIDLNRRFYKAAAVTGVPGAWCISLDGKEIKTPMRNDFIARSRALADAIAAEWAAQETRIKPHTMPLTQLLNTAVDRVAPERARIVAETAGYAETDLICHRAEAPLELVSRQSAAWDPLLEWIRERFDVSLTMTAGVIAVAQPAGALAILRHAVEAQDDLHLTALATLTSATGSLVLGLAILERRLTTEEAAASAQLDELFQAERWGSDPEAETRRAGQRDDIVQSGRFLELVEAGEG